MTTTSAADRGEALMFARQLVAASESTSNDRDDLAPTDVLLEEYAANPEAGLVRLAQTALDLEATLEKWEPVISAAITLQDCESGPLHPEFCEGACDTCANEEALYRALSLARGE